MRTTDPSNERSRAEGDGMMDRAIEILRGLDTPTVCNAIEIAQGSRDFSGFTKKPMTASHPDASAIVGKALTAKIRARTPPAESAADADAARMEYYKYVSSGPKPSVVVVQDLDSPEPYGAFWGEVNATVHRAFGIAGVVTDGLVRDLGELPAGFPIIAGAAGVSHAFVRVVEFGTPVEIFGMAVRPGDLIHADRHGALAVREDALPRLEDAVRTLLEREKIVLDPAREMDGYGFEAFRRSWERSKSFRG